MYLSKNITHYPIVANISTDVWRQTIKCLQRYDNLVHKITPSCVLLMSQAFSSRLFKLREDTIQETSTTSSVLFINNWRDIDNDLKNNQGEFICTAHLECNLEKGKQSTVMEKRNTSQPIAICRNRSQVHRKLTSCSVRSRSTGVQVSVAFMP